MSILGTAEGFALTPADDTSLDRRLAKGDTAAFEQVVALYQPRVSRLAFRLLGWRGDVDDVVQDVFLTVLDKARGFRGDSTLWTWLTAVTINRCRSQHRRAVLFGRFCFWASGKPADLAKSADSSVVEDETSARVRSAVAALPATCREAIVLFYLEQRSLEEMSGILGVSSNACEVRLHRARQKLKVLLADLEKE